MAFSNGHKTAVANVRASLKALGIKALVSCDANCGREIAHIVVPTFNTRFTANEIELFTAVLKDLGFTGARRSEIVPAHEANLTSKRQFTFEYWGN